MVTVGSITYKNQLTIPKQVVERFGLKKIRKVLILPQEGGFLVKPIASSVDLLAGSLARPRWRHNVNRKREREQVQKMVAEEVAKEGL